MDTEVFNQVGNPKINYTQASSSGTQQKQNPRKNFPDLRPPKGQIQSQSFGQKPNKAPPKGKKVSHFEKINGMQIPIFEPEVEETNTNTSTDTTTSQPPQGSGRIPPITIIDTHMYKVVKETLGANQTTPRYTVSTKEGLKVFLSSPDEYRTTIRILDQLNIKRFTYTLKEDKPLQVVLRGVPLCITEQDVEESLREQDIQPTTVKRLRKNAETQYELILVTAENSEQNKNLFEIRQIMGVGVRPERKRRPTNASQCFRCQNYGHVQRNCKFVR